MNAKDFPLVIQESVHATIERQGSEVNAGFPDNVFSFGSEVPTHSDPFAGVVGQISLWVDADFDEQHELGQDAVVTIWVSSPQDNRDLADDLMPIRLKLDEAKRLQTQLDFVVGKKSRYLDLQNGGAE
jgi:hypothetical protein